jgi:hypothetical protein
MNKQQILEELAKAMAEYSGWDMWDTATDCRHTPNGNDVDEEKSYWRELATIAYEKITNSA